MKYFLPLLIMLSLVPGIAQANQTDTEIEYLLTTMSSSECTFIRNGKEYDAAAAESHLRMKYKRGKRYVSTTEEFIDRLASKSSMSKKPYYIACGGAEPTPSGQWLTALLNEYRAN